MRGLILGLTILCAVASPAVADNKAKAKALYEKGLEAYNLTDYAEAITAWREAYSLSKKPILLFNIGQAYRLDGDCKKAMGFYDSYQREEPNPKNQEELETAIGLCQTAGNKPADKPADKPAVVGTKPPVDKTPSPEKPADKPTAEVPPPRMVAQWDDDESIDQPVADTGADVAGKAPSRKAAIAVTIAAVGFAGGAIGFELWGRSLLAQSADELHWETQDALYDKANLRHKIAQGLGVAGVAATGVAIYLWIRGGSDGASSSAMLVPAAASDQLGLVLMGRL